MSTGIGTSPETAMGSGSDTGQTAATGAAIGADTTVTAPGIRSSTTPNLQTVTLLAPRLRVEERQLQAAFRARGIATAHVDTDSITLPVIRGLAAHTLTQSTTPSLGSIIMDRDVATDERATLAALLAAQPGVLVVNRAATTRLLADRLALLRHLQVANLPLPTTLVAFSEAAAVAALDEIGLPVLLQSRSVLPAPADVVAHDRDTAEALLEHRAMLAGQTLTLLQQYIPGPTLRAVVVGTAVLGLETLTHVAGSTSGMTFAPFTGDDATRKAVLELVQAVIARLGSGVYDVKVVLGPDGPVIVGAGNLVDFRSLSASGINVAGAIVEWVLGMTAQMQGEESATSSTGAATDGADQADGARG